MPVGSDNAKERQKVPESAVNIVFQSPETAIVISISKLNVKDL